MTAETVACAASRSAPAAQPLAAQRAADAAADRHRGAAEGAGGRRLPQRPASLRRLFRSRRRQAAEPGRSRHEAADHARPRERRRGGGGRARRRKGVKIGDRAAGRSLDRLRRLRGLQARRGAALHQAMRSLGVFRNGGYSRSSDGAASALSVRHRRPAAGARGAARLLGRHHLRRAEEGRPDAHDRADGDHRRRRARPDVPRACTRRWAATAPIVVDIDPAKREAAKKAGAQRGDRRRRARRGAADHRGDQGRRLGGDRSGRLVRHRAARHRQPDQGRQVHHRRPLRRRHHAVAAAVPDARHHDPGLLCRQPARDARS